MARKEEFQFNYIRRMTEETLDITTTEGKQDFVRNLIAYNIILEGIWFYSGFMVALSFRQRNLLRNFGSLMDWVIRDESLHLKFGINLILTVLEENPDLQTPEFAAEIKQMILDAVTMEEEYNQGPAARRHPRPQRRLHQPVRQVPGRPAPGGAGLRGRVQGVEPGEVDGHRERHLRAGQLLRVHEHLLRGEREGGCRGQAGVDVRDPLITADELAALLGASDRVRVLDVRWSLGGPPGLPLYREGHIPGAVYVDLETQLAAHGAPTEGRHPLPAVAALQDAARRGGINTGDTVVVYDDLAGMSAARAWWLLRYAGVEDVRLLDGALSAWQSAGHPLHTGDETPPRAASS